MLSAARRTSDPSTTRIKKDANLKSGFNALGNSQGALLMRAYINRENTPPVRRFLGVVLGCSNLTTAQ